MSQDDSLWAKLKAYMRSFYMIELIFCTLLSCGLMALSLLIPTLERDLPYLISDDGDTLLNQSLNHSKGPQTISCEKKMCAVCEILYSTVKFMF